MVLHWTPNGAQLADAIASIANALQTAEPLVDRLRARERDAQDAQDFDTLATVLRAATVALRAFQKGGA